MSGALHGSHCRCWECIDRENRPQRIETKGGEPADEREEIEAVIACLGDDAAILREDNPEDERADNMERAAELLEALQSKACASVGVEPIYQVRKSFLSDPPNVWRDAAVFAYDVSPEEDRRIVYATPPAAPAVFPAPEGFGALWPNGDKGRGDLSADDDGAHAAAVPESPAMCSDCKRRETYKTWPHRRPGCQQCAES